MHRRLAVIALSLALLVSSLAAAGAAAAPPSSGSAAGSSAGQGQHQHQSSSSPLTFGAKIKAAVQAALANGGGQSVAAAVYQVQSTIAPDQRAASIAQSVAHGLLGTGHKASPFKDMGQASWALGAVDALSAAGVVDGTSASTFSPNTPVTAAQALTMLDKLFHWAEGGSPTSGSALDRNAPSYAQAAIDAAQSDGYLQGVANLNAPSTVLTRAQAVVLLINALGLRQQAAQASADLKGPVPQWARGAIALAVKLGLLKGVSGSIDANAPLTRAQLAVLLARAALFASLATSAP